MKIIYENRFSGKTYFYTMASRGSTIGGNNVRTLEKKNKALNNATKELEEKVKNLRERTVHRSLPKVGQNPGKTLQGGPSGHGIDNVDLELRVAF